MICLSDNQPIDDDIGNGWICDDNIHDFADVIGIGENFKAVEWITGNRTHGRDFLAQESHGCFRKSGDSQAFKLTDIAVYDTDATAAACQKNAFSSWDWQVTETDNGVYPLFQRVDPDSACLAEKGFPDSVIASQCAGVRGNRPGTCLRDAGLQDDKRLAQVSQAETVFCHLRRLPDRQQSVW